MNLKHIRKQVCLRSPKLGQALARHMNRFYLLRGGKGLVSSLEEREGLSS